MRISVNLSNMDPVLSWFLINQSLVKYQLPIFVKVVLIVFACLSSLFIFLECKRDHRKAFMAINRSHPQTNEKNQKSQKLLAFSSNHSSSHDSSSHKTCSIRRRSLKLIKKGLTFFSNKCFVLAESWSRTALVDYFPEGSHRKINILNINKSHCVRTRKGNK